MRQPTDPVRDVHDIAAATPAPTVPHSASPPGRLTLAWLRLRRNWASTMVGLLTLAVLAAAGYAVATSQHVRWQVVAHYFPSGLILRGTVVTFELTVVSMVAGICLAVVLAVMRLSKSRILRTVSGSYIWFFRGTPLLVQLIFWYNIALFVPRLSFAGASVSTNTLITPLTAALLGLSLNVAAYEAEIVRAGILAIDRGQTEAALALGMTSRQALFRIVMPQAARVMIPPTGNQTIDMLKATSLVSVIGTGDLLTRAQDIYAQNFYVVELLIVASGWYLFMTTIATFLQGLLERRLSRSLKKTARTGYRG